MSIDSALIVRKDRLITIAELTAAIAERGVTIVFPADFALDRDVQGWVSIQVDGEATGFEYGVEALSDLDVDIAPAKLRRHGDTMLSFAARGGLSAEAVSLIQRVLAERCGAVGWIEQEVVSSREMAREAVIPEDMDPDLAATLRGTPAERAAAMEAYVAKFYPPQPPRRENAFMEWLKRDRRLEFGVFAAALAALILWTILK